MGASPNGTKQKTYYVREDLARIMAMLASRSGKKESELVSEALDFYLRKVLNEDEMRVFGYKSGDQNGRSDNGTTSNVGSDRRSSGSDQGQPIPKKRLRKAHES